MKPIRVLVVDDSAFMRTVICQMLATAPDIRVVGQAASGKEGLRMARDLKPDVITLDVEMPGMSGLEMLTILMNTTPTPAIMLSTLTQAGAEVTLKGLEMGAVDYLPKNLERGPLAMRKIAPQLIEKVRAIGTGETRQALHEALKPRPRANSSIPDAAHDRSALEKLAHASDLRIVAIGSSIGGPAALCQLVPALPPNLNAAVLIAQHMPAGFTKALADRLNALSRMPVREAVDGEPLEAGTVLVAKGGRHLTVEETANGLQARLLDTPKIPMMPAVDELYKSLAETCPEQTLAVVLTGMGTDGCLGSCMISAQGGTVFAQSRTGCLVYGMPKAVIEAGVAERVVDIGQMADDIYVTINHSGLKAPVR